VSLAREGVHVVSRLYVSEQARCDIILKTWKANIAEGKNMAREVKEACEESFQLLNKESLGLEKDDSSEILRQVDIAKHQLNIKTTWKWLRLKSCY
jgi:hypothetical protein